VSSRASNCHHGFAYTYSGKILVTLPPELFAECLGTIGNREHDQSFPGRIVHVGVPFEDVANTRIPNVIRDDGLEIIKRSATWCIVVRRIIVALIEVSGKPVCCHGAVGEIQLIVGRRPGRLAGGGHCRRKPVSSVFCFNSHKTR
jgi:hypothetical protein